MSDCRSPGVDQRLGDSALQQREDRGRALDVTSGKSRSVAAKMSDLQLEPNAMQGIRRHHDTMPHSWKFVLSLPRPAVQYF